MKIDDILSKAVLSLNSLSETPKLDAEMILSFVLKISRFDLFARRAEFIEEKDRFLFEQLIKRRQDHEPVAYITNEKAFFEDIFYVDRRVLVPRPETEFLVTETIHHLEKFHKKPSVLDICCGSGCVGLSVLRVVDCEMTLSDISDDALDVAKINAKKLFPEKNDVKIINSDLFKNIEEKYDVITANPPYLSQNDMKEFVKGPLTFEPVSALFGGFTGIEVTEKIIEQAAEYLSCNGVLIIELGFEGSRFLKNTEKLNINKIVKDYSGIDRVAVFSLRKPGM